jgi:hypothetical protein
LNTSGEIDPPDFRAGLGFGSAGAGAAGRAGGGDGWRGSGCRGTGCGAAAADFTLPAGGTGGVLNLREMIGRFGGEVIHLSVVAAGFAGDI